MGHFGYLESKCQDRLRLSSDLSEKCLWRVKKQWSRSRRGKHSNCDAVLTPANGDRERGKTVEEEPHT